MVKKREISFPPTPDSEYIPCEQMAEFPVLALWGNENAELLFAIILFWGDGLWCFFFWWRESGTGKFGKYLLIIDPTNKGYFKIQFFLFYVCVNIREDYSE